MRGFLGFGAAVLIGATGVSTASHSSTGTATRTAKPTYAKDIAPLLNRSCVACHRPGEVAPFSLVGYSNAKKWAKMATIVTASRQMPPFHAADKDTFLDDRRLSEAEIKLVKDWESAGCPRGDAKSEPVPPPAVTSKWRLGEPDQIVGPTRPFKVGSEGHDIYRYFIIPNDSDDSKWVKGTDVQIDNRKIVHHIIAWVDRSGLATKYQREHQDGQEGYTFDGGPNFLPDAIIGVWAPGMNPHFTPEGTAIELKPHSKIVLQVHYTRSGKAEEDQSKVGIYFQKEEPKNALRIRLLDDLRLRIPAGDKAFTKVSKFKIPSDSTLFAVMPHMHMLGRSMNAKAIFPDGKQLDLIHVPDWDFNWQFVYWYKKPLDLPAGTEIEFTATYDNSANNPRNPHNPPKDISWGEETKNEMSLLGVAIARKK